MWIFDWINSLEWKRFQILKDNLTGPFSFLALIYELKRKRTTDETDLVSIFLDFHIYIFECFQMTADHE